MTGTDPEQSTEFVAPLAEAADLAEFLNPDGSIKDSPAVGEDDAL